MFDQGSGPPLVVIPGVQGRWEWMTPALSQLTRHFRTLAYSLSGDIGSGRRFDPARGFDCYVDQLDEVLRAAGVGRAALCGVSYGGCIAVRYAARHPERVSALILVSSPAPGWLPSPEQRHYLARPWRSLPAFIVSAPRRLWPEIAAALDGWPARMTFIVSHSLRVLAAPMIPSIVAARVAAQQAVDLEPDCARVSARALVVTGEPDLDRVVPVAVTRRYLRLLPDAQHVTLPHTGHLGMLTQPERFASLVAGFLDHPREAADRGAAREHEGAVHAHDY